MVSLEDASRLRRVLIDGHECLTVTVHSLERIIALVEEMWPELLPTGRLCGHR